MKKPDLFVRLREHAEGPMVCPRCGNRRDRAWTVECPEEGQCDWNMHFGTHTDGGIDIYKAKEDMLEAAVVLENLKRQPGVEVVQHRNRFKGAAQWSEWFNGKPKAPSDAYDYEERTLYDADGDASWRETLRRERDARLLEIRLKEHFKAQADILKALAAQADERHKADVAGYQQELFHLEGGIAAAQTMLTQVRELLPAKPRLPLTRQIKDVVESGWDGSDEPV